MGIPVSLIIQRAGFALLDEDHIRWTSDELVSWINEAARAVVVRRNDAGAYTDNFTLIAGTKQTLPANVFRLIDVIRNMGTGSTPGRVVKRCDRQLLDNFTPGWHADPAAAVTRNFCYDDGANPQVFYVHPPANANKVLECIFARLPPPVDNITMTEVDMDDGFGEALLNFVLYRCYAKDSEFADAAKAAAFMSAFQASLGEAAK